jgi:hypothetical protein
MEARPMLNARAHATFAAGIAILGTVPVTLLADVEYPPCAAGIEALATMRSAGAYLGTISRLASGGDSSWKGNGPAPISSRLH